MKKILLALSLLTFRSAIAQPDGRVFTIVSDPYVHLTSPIIVTTPGWDDFDATIPLGFNFTALGATTDTLYFDSEFNSGFDVSFDSFSKGPTNLITTFVDYIDRSDLNPTEISHVAYRTDVVNGKKITKIEARNVGFYDGNPNDSTNIQLWFYEGTNTIEARWGGSNITANLQDIFLFGDPLFGFIKNIDLVNENLDWFYYVSSTSPAKMDSLDLNGFMNATTMGTPQYPANGTVYRFSYAVTGIEGTILNTYTTVYPTQFTDQFHIEISENRFVGKAFMLDMNGKIVAQQDIREGKNTIATAGLPAGNYIVNIKNDKESVFYKIVKQ